MCVEDAGHRRHQQLKGTRAVAQMLRISQRTVERYVKDQIKKPRSDLAVRLRKRWQPQIRAQARQRAATSGGIIIGTRAPASATPPPSAPPTRTASGT